MRTQLKAYEVYDGGDNWATVFATNGATARRKGASECECEFNEVNHCRRKPELDQYAPGPVPPLAMIAMGWHYECGHCGINVDTSMDACEFEHDDEGNDITEDAAADKFKPTPDGQMVYCCEAHKMAAWQERQAEKNVRNAVCEAAYYVVPDGLCVAVWSTGTRPNQKPALTASIKVPGLTYAVTWQVGEHELSLAQCDVEAWYARTKSKSSEAAKTAEYTEVIA